jgi:hypothetical protein
VSAEACTSAGKCVFSAGVMARVAYVPLSIACFIAMEVVERRLAACRQWPVVTVMRVKTIIHVTIETVVPVEPGTRSKENAADKPVGPIVAVGRAVIRRIVEVPVGAGRLDTDTDSDLGWPKG